MARVRIALDLDTEDGKELDIANAIFEDRKKILDFIANVVVPNNSEVSSVKVKGFGGNSHQHSTERDDMPCEHCREYAKRTRLAQVSE